MIHLPGRPDPPAARLLAPWRDRTGPEVLALSSGSARPEALDRLLEEWMPRRTARLLVLGSLGTHRDAKAGRLRALWTIEEKARSTGLPVLALRLAPLVGPSSPLWLRLRSGGLPARAASFLLQPVAEADVQRTIERAFAEEGDWSGWFEVAGPEPLTLAELSEIAGRGSTGSRGAWEPSLAEMGEQRLVDVRPWSERFGIQPAAIRREADAWA